MAKKLKRDQDQQTADVVRMSSQEIWQAGLQAFAKAQEEEGKFFSMQLFEERVLRALSSIGVPTAVEVQALTRRIDELSAQLAALSGQSVAVPKTATKKAAVKKTASIASKASKAKQTTAKKTTAKKSSAKVAAAGKLAAVAGKAKSAAK